MNLEELEEELENILPPGFTIETDNHGRVVIHTNLQLDDDGELVPTDDEDEDEDEEFEGDDEDLEPLPDEDDDD